MFLIRRGDSGKSSYKNTLPLDYSGEIIPNYNEYAFANVVDEDNEKKDLLTYNRILTEDEQMDIIDCFAGDLETGES